MDDEARARAAAGGDAIVTRFAPSPNGELHLGHALSAMVGHDIARCAGGRFLVRIEDIDVARCRESFIASILDDLAWLGLEWEQPVLRQSRHFADYAAAARRLQRLGVVYPCFATRGEIAAAVRAVAGASGAWPCDPDGAPLYPRLHQELPPAVAARRIESGEPHALRLDMAKALSVARGMLGGRALTFVETGVARAGADAEAIVAADPARWGDAVIVRKEFPASYHLAVVIDDARQGVTLVTRGADLYEATGLHRLLQVLLELPEPRYHHHRLLLGGDGRKLSKSLGAASLRSLRAAGLTAADVRRRVGLAEIVRGSSVQA